MSDEAEKKALMEELDRLRAQAGAVDGTKIENANRERQQEIIDRLADLGVQLG